MDRLREETKISGNERQFEQLKAYLTSGELQVPYRRAAEALHTSEGAVKVTVRLLRQRFGRCLRAELAETVTDPAEVDDALRHMLSILGSWRVAV